uniref:Latrophilin Cirl n=1 Tax=Elaeophora elaphi TaxID=1147741 RepID=A0A0R3RJM4_9BILA
MKNFPISSAANNSAKDETNFRRKRPFCEEYDWHGITVPRTSACSETQIPCPDHENTIGVTTQKCSCESNEWEGKPNTLNCTHKWIGSLLRLIETEAPADHISRKWALLLQNSTKQMLFGGDLVGSIVIGEKLLELANIQYTILDGSEKQDEKAIEFIKHCWQMYGKAGNELLSDRAAEVWMTLADNTRIREVSSLISLLEQSATMMADFIVEKEKKIEYSNWGKLLQKKRLYPFEVQVKNPVPMEFESGHMDSNEKSMLIRRSNSFDALPMTDAITSDNAAFDEPNGNVTFNFSLSPVLSMPPLRILRQSAVSTFVVTMSDSLAEPRPQFTSSSSNSLFLAYYVFRSVGALLNANKTTITNSLVIGAIVDDPMTSISLPESYPVTFKFYHIRTNGVNNPRCVFWDTSKKIWSKEGCKTLRTMNDSTECACTHLTSFAILMDITGLHDHDDKSVVNEVLNLTTMIGCIFSIVCLFLASLIFSCFRSLWNVRHMIHCNLCFCLLLAELIFVIGIDRTENKTICRAVAVILHYLFLAAFCWMLLEGYQLYLMLVQVFEDKEGKTVVYCLFAYGFPAVIVAVTAGVAWSNYSTDQYCWLNVETPTIWAFAGPIAVVIVCNIVFLGVALRVVLSVSNRQQSRAQQMLGWLKGSATLLCLLGVTWIFGYLMVIQGATTVFAYIFTVLNCLQGVFIFIIHVILNDKVRFTLLRCLRANICCTSDTVKTASVVSSRQKLTAVMKNSDLSRVSSQPPIESGDFRGVQQREKGSFVEKISARMDGKGSPTTMITYLDWKRKVSNDSVSIPSDDSGNYDCEKKETFPSLADTAMISDQSGKNFNIDSKGKSFPIRRKISYNNNNATRQQRRKSSENSITVERF